MWRIHAEMADTYFEMRRYRESAHHWSEAIRWSPYVDVDLKLLIRLTEAHIDAEHYRQAYATSRAANKLSTHIDTDNDFPFMLTIRPNVLTAVSLSRLEHHSDAIDHSRRLIEQLIRKLKDLPAVD